MLQNRGRCISFFRDMVSSLNIVEYFNMIGSVLDMCKLKSASKSIVKFRTIDCICLNGRLLSTFS